MAQRSISGRDGRADGFEEAREAILAALLERAPFDGWTPVSIRQAASAVSLHRATLFAAFPKGVADVLAYWSDMADRAISEKLAAAEVGSLRVRERVALGVRERLNALAPHKEAARRAAATLALPVFAPLAARLAWKTADAIWRALGDKSTDFNFYSKRVILTGVWLSTFARWLADDSADEHATNEFLDRRIANVMQFEKVKAKVRDTGFDPEGMFGWLAKRRYPAPKDAEAAKGDGAVEQSARGSGPSP